jgi:hypothetical protein
MLLKGAAQIEETAFSNTCVQLRLITILGNCGCVAVASFLGVPSPSEPANIPIGHAPYAYLNSFSAVIQCPSYRLEKA